MSSSTHSKSLVESMKDALASNFELQAQVAGELEKIALKKRDNRTLAARANEHIVACWNQLDDLHTQNAEEYQTEQVETIAGKRKRKKIPKRWQYDPYRRWTRQFFVDPKSTVLEPNEDTKRRRQLEKEKNGLFYHLSHPWSNKETQLLKTIVAERMPKHESQQLSSSGVDFNQVALELKQRIPSDRNRPTTALPRTAEECRLKYLDSTPLKPLNKQQSLQLLEQVHRYQQNNEIIPWDTLAQEYGMTTWQCFTTYTQKLAPSPGTPWTQEEDELLLKYAACRGPQWVLNNASASLLSQHVLTTKSPKQIFARANASLANPKFVHDVWTAEDEMKLAFCMKIYKNAPSPLVRAAIHFPHRAASSVAQKWTRSLDPAYLSTPFTEEEDEALIEAVKTHLTDSGTIRWADLARDFPTPRHFNSLASRWKENLASQEDILKQYNSSIKSQKGAFAKSNELLNTDDFVVRVKGENREEDDGGHKTDL